MRRTITLSLALLAALAPAAVASAAAPHPYSSSFEMSALSAGDGYPNPGGATVLSGAWRIKGFAAGDGATLLDRLTITGHPTDAVFTFKGGETGFLAGGTINSVYTGWSMVRPDGTLAV